MSPRLTALSAASCSGNSSRGSSFQIRAPSPKEEPGGFGLLLVDQLSSRWGVDGGDDYTVWFEIDREPVLKASSS